MTEAIQTTVLDLLVELAPEFEAGDIDLDEDLRDQLDIDSMDIHQLATRLYETFGVDVPESDRAELTTVRRCVAYIASNR
ncbi:MAG: acyl carrier protein [Deltaproteobacteria bacterium]|nr:MAG: acyl carrier protein [Deltaproteobacteria bacterium]